MSFVLDYLRELKRHGNRGRCLHFADGIRCNEIISAHSIQKRGQLGLIAESGKVYQLNADLSTLRASGGVIRPKKVGINQASTFVGFCKHHDNALFEPIDNAPLKSKHQQIALYAYRCLCRGYFAKENAVAVLDKMKDHPAITADRQRSLRSSLEGHSDGFEGLKYHKEYYDKALRTKNYDEFDFVYFTSSSRCSLQLSGLFYPDFDFVGQTLQDLRRWESPLDLITFFTAPTSGGWAFGFGWHKSSARSCIPFIRSLASCIENDESIEDALLRFSLSCCENHAFRISWWDGLAESVQQSAVERMQLMTHPTLPVPPDYLANGCENLADWSFENFHTSLVLPD